MFVDGMSVILQQIRDLEWNYLHTHYVDRQVAVIRVNAMLERHIVAAWYTGSDVARMLRRVFQ